MNNKYSNEVTFMYLITYSQLYECIVTIHILPNYYNSTYKAKKKKEDKYRMVKSFITH